MSHRPEVHLLALGGTIAMAPSSDEMQGVKPQLGAADLLAAVPELSGSDVSLSFTDVLKKPGASLSVDDIAALAQVIAEREQEGASGFVVTQGTDTIEETAYLLDLFHTGQAPVVVTGAMRHHSMPSADGPANLLAAVQTAASAGSRGMGCLVVFSDRIHAGRFVRKEHATAPGAFASPHTGPIGYITEGAPRLLLTPAPQQHVPLPLLRPARVALITAGLGDDGELLQGLGDRFDGVVIAAFGAGHVPETWADPLEKMAEQIPVVFASRTGAGSTTRNTYGFPGSERDLLRRGLVAARDLDPYKARLLLLAHLRAGSDRNGIAAAFA
ncbi:MULTISPECIES: asparaginase [Streptomyces]|uniref:Asparaginase n=1 Tax=Streptomyces griseiscabiei TaxID=2993540 RepID=A0ABU4LG35_9ACTN|nr:MULTISPECIES: asparaginase [Streptomyces]MDX2913973.1 asparaginase [Streptomyces griseiscabiei]